LLTESGMKNIIDNNIDKFIADLETAKLTTALDVEEKSYYVLDARKEEEIFNPLKTFIYNNPNLDIFSCLYVGSLYLREYYLRKHPELK